MFSSSFLKPIILGFTGPLYTKIKFMEIKTHDLGAGMAYIHVQEEYDLKVPVFAIYWPPPPAPPSHPGDPAWLLHANLWKEDFTHVFSVTRSHMLGEVEGEGEG
jgi:hypothetical protein